MASYSAAKPRSCSSAWLASRRRQVPTLVMLRRTAYRGCRETRGGYPSWLIFRRPSEILGAIVREDKKKLSAGLA